ncbi:MAG TPA: hypothetical protein VGR45_13320 [Stellaceae bacterium]|nr:hypothetical protein [Stellaceae bacterium]
MRRLLIRSVLSVLAVAILAVAWIVAGPWWAWALDAIHTTRLATVTSLSIKKDSGFFRFIPGRNGAPLPEAEGFTWYDWGNPLERVGIQLDRGGVLVLIDDDRRFVLGRCPGAMDDHGYIPAIEPEPGDVTSITLDRGVASWPTPFHITCCGSLGGGGSWYPWARYLYWHLSWIKADGARLDMFARFEQNYENGSGWNDPGAARLVRLDIRPARRDRPVVSGDR